MGKRKKWNLERLLGISAMSISFITLMIFIYQTNLMRKQNYLSILPYLSISSSNSSATNSFSIILENYGVGPGIIDEVTMSYLDEKYDLSDYNNELFTLLKTVTPALDKIKNISYSTLEPGMAVPANTTYSIVEIQNDSTDYILFKDTVERLLENGLLLNIEYRSIQNERWEITNMSKGPTKLD